MIRQEISDAQNGKESESISTVNSITLGVENLKESTKNSKDEERSLERVQGARSVVQMAVTVLHGAPRWTTPLRWEQVKTGSG